MDITTEQIDALRTEAAAAGDLAMVEICEAAAAGDEDARLKCEDAISSAASLADITERVAAYAAERAEGLANGTW